MKAAVCRDFGKPLVIEDIEIASPQVGELKVSMKACGICQSDVHSIDGAWGGVLPAVFGHEAAGIVEQVGEGVEEFDPGQPVVVTLVRACHRCFFCAQGQPALCETTFRLDVETPLMAVDGAAVRQGLRTGAFAESILVDASQAIAIRDDVPFESACLLACAVITGFGAVVNTAQVPPASSVVVLGTGGVGLNAVQAAAISGAEPVIAVDTANRKLEIACRLGATHAINPSRENVEEQVRSLTKARGADTVVVTVGSGTAVEQGMTLLRRGGTLVVVGMPATGVRSDLQTAEFAHDGQRIVGSKMGSAQPQIDVPRLIDLYRDGRLKLNELVTNRFALAEINDAIASTKGGDAVRNVVVF